MANTNIVVICLALWGSLSVQADNRQMIEIQPRDFISANMLSDKEQEEIRKSNYARGFGEVEYAFETPAEGWRELWLEGSDAPFDLILDGETVIHAKIESGVWKPDGHLQKMLNLWLAAGKHTLRISRPQPFGIPWIHRICLKPPTALDGQVRAQVLTDALARRAGEPLPVKLLIGKGGQPAVVRIAVTPAKGDKAVWTKEIAVPTGSGNLEQRVQLPADAEGAFEARFTDAAGAPVDRTIQYLVVDMKHRPAQTAEPARELVQTIDCAATEPDYASSKTTVARAPFGAYRETGDKGRVGYNLNADWFAYTVTVPTLHEPYLAEIEYPDDDERVAIISLIDRVPNPYAPTLGYVSGGIYSLSEKMATQDFYFYPREKDMRLFIQTWRTGMKAAMGKVRIYRLSSMPPAVPVPDGGRAFGGYQEENIRFTSYYGATPSEGNAWDNYFRAACRYAENQRFIGGNFWQQTIGNYQNTLWPQKTIFGYGPEDTTSYDLEGGPILPVHPSALDIVRLQLLVCEKYGLGYLGELHLPPNANFKKHMDKLFGGKGTLDDNGPQKPWLLFSDKNKHFDDSNSGDGYWNPLYPGVQNWTASVIQELADRYKDSPAFKGVALRLACWCFSSWPCFPSIHSGYEDYTVGLFEKETGFRIPVDAADPARFSKRYAWLMSNARDAWIGWRCQKIYAYHCRLAKILTDARPDLKLVLHASGPDFSRDYEFADELREHPWGEILLGTGIDPKLYNANPALVLQDEPMFPTSRSRAHTPLQCANQRDCNWDAGQYTATAHREGSGTVESLMFSADSFEGEMVESKALGFEAVKNRNVTTIHGAGEINPAGIHFLDRFAEALAHGNVTLMASGNHGYDQQQARHLRPFLHEYRLLPDIGMNPVEPDADPVAVWQGTDKGKHYFYAVNRLDRPVAATLSFSSKAKPQRLSTGERLRMKNGELTLTLDPYQLLAFTGGSDAVRVTGVQADIPDAIKAVLRQQLDFSKRLLAGGTEAHALDLSPAQFRLGRETLARAETALASNRAWTARHLLLSLPMTRLYEAFKAYPPNLYFRAAGNKGTPALGAQSGTGASPLPSAPSLHFVKQIGDARGKSLDNLAVTAGADGKTYLLQASGRIVVFRADGSYARSLHTDLSRLDWRQHLRYLSADGANLLAGTCEEDFPWVYAPEREGRAPGRFASPQQTCVDAHGTVYVADGGNRRIQIFSPEKHDAPARIIPLAFNPSALAVGEFNSAPVLAVGGPSEFGLYSLNGTNASPFASQKISGLKALALGGPKGPSVLAATADSLRGYVLRDGHLTEGALISEPYQRQWPNLFRWDAAFVQDAKGRICFPTDQDGRLLTLDPQTDTLRDAGAIPWRTRAIAFGPNGTLFTANHENKSSGAVIHTYAPDANGWKPAADYTKKALYAETGAPVWGMIWDRDSLIVRVVEEGYQKGWPALSIKRLLPDGTLRPFLDFGPLFAVRTRFAPWEATYAFKHDRDGNLIFTARPLVALYKLTPEGKVIWEAGITPQGGADAVDFKHPRDVAVDHRNRIWVTDMLLDTVFCFSPDGKKLAQFGTHAEVDDAEGKGFDHPAGLAVVPSGDREFLYIGDAGNQRILKYRIE